MANKYGVFTIIIFRISFHEEEVRSHSLSRPASRKSLHDDCILPPVGQFERPVTATATLDDIDIEDPYPSLAHVRTSASGLLRCPESDGLEGDESDHPAPCPPPMQERLVQIYSTLFAFSSTQRCWIQNMKLWTILNWLSLFTYILLPRRQGRCVDGLIL